MLYLFKFFHQPFNEHFQAFRNKSALRVHITADEVKAIRARLNLSQSVFAKRLRTSVKTYQGWEQGKSTPNPQATILLRLVEQSPQIFEQIARL